MSRLIDRFHHVDRWVAEAPASLLLLCAFLSGLGLMVLIGLAMWVMR